MSGFDYGYRLQLANGEQYNTYAATNERYQVGQLGFTGDGRAYRFAKNGGSTLVAGNVIQAPAPVTNHVNQTATATAIGATAVTFTIGGTSAVADQYKDGVLSVSVTPGAGLNYLLGPHVSNAGSVAYAWPLAPGESIRVALTTTSRLDLIANPYRGVIQAPVTTLTAQPVGIAVSTPLLNQYCWIQVQGLATVLTSGTVIIGEQVISPAGAAGAVGPNSAGGSETEVVIGTVMRVAATTAWSAIMLTGFN